MYLFYAMDNKVADEMKVTEGMKVKVIYTHHSNNRVQKTTLPCAIAFDLDETLGSFSDFYSIWARLEDDTKTQSNFNEIMDMYPEFLRVGILSILKYIKSKQDAGVCLPIYIYTNNQCEDVSWIYKLIEYLEYRVWAIPTVKQERGNRAADNVGICNILHAKLFHNLFGESCNSYTHRSSNSPPNSPKECNTAKIFARPICAFKIRGKRVEPGRTTHEKTYADFVQCSMLSSSHELCFIDDVFYRKMKNRKVYYIQPPPYVHQVPYGEVVHRFLTSNIYRRLYANRTPSSNTPVMFIDASDNTTEWSEKDERKITNKIMYNIREFFLIHSRKRATKKREYRIGNFTRKKG